MERAYRGVMEPEGLECYAVAIGESDLYVCTRGDFREDAARSLARHRKDLEAYLSRHVDFGTSFRPVPVDREAPAIVRAMAAAAAEFDVGPMAAVAGAIAQHVGTDLLGLSPDVIVENGGDIFLAGSGTRVVRVFSGAAGAALDIAVEVESGGVGLCTSSATVGPSVSLGSADAVTVLARTAAGADAAATAIGNRVLVPDDIEPGLDAARGHASVLGALVQVEGSLGIWGSLQVVGGGHGRRTLL